MGKPIGASMRRRSRTPSEVFGRAVTELRTRRNISQASLAAELGYSTFYLGKVERGQANASCDVMAAFAEFFDMSIGELWIYAEHLQRRKS
jgi:transcriptional regulator with XRE-family HTH domain